MLFTDGLKTASFIYQLLNFFPPKVYEGTQIVPQFVGLNDILTPKYRFLFPFSSAFSLYQGGIAYVTY